MKILILTSPHPLKASGIVAYDLLDCLSSIEGNDVRILVRKWDKYEDSRIVTIETTIEHYLYAIIRGIKRVSKTILKLVFENYKTKNEILKEILPGDYYLEYIMTETFYSTNKIIRRTGFKPDIVVVLFMTEFISFKNLHEIFKLTGAPIYLYLMDMAPFTGGCHYSSDCTGYIRECGNCRALYSNLHNDQTRHNYLYKKKYIEKTNIYPIAASEWQFVQLNKSSLFKDKRKFKAILPVNENQYFPSDKTNSRQELGLPIGKKIIFFGAVSIDEKRKGINELTNALNILFQNVEDPSMIHLVIAGNNGVNFVDKLSFSYTLLGYLDHNSLPKVFQAADVFVSPSIEDSGPMMVNQSIMCGTPVVAFEIGVALDLVCNNETGYIAKLKDCKDLAHGIKYILELEDLEYKKMSLKCRETGLSLCRLKKKAENLMKIFNNQL
jgi:glycosyltransferase involved in cell wall biosynthesis